MRPSLQIQHPQALTGNDEVAKKKPYLTPITPLSDSFSCIQLPFDSLSPHVRYSETPNYPRLTVRIATGCFKMASVDHLHEETKMLPVQDHLSLISSQYLARALQPNNPSHSVVTSRSGIRNKKQSVQSQFLYCVAPYLSSDIRF